MKKTTILIVLVLGLLVAWVSISFVITKTNCGGNSAALVYTGETAAFIGMELEGNAHTSHAMFVDLVPPSVWHSAFNFGWGVKSYWVLKKIDSSETGPVVICAQCFENVPKPTIWNLYRKSPAFAAGFLRGRARLLEMQEFNSLDLHRYEYVTEKDVADYHPDDPARKTADPRH